MSSSDEPVAACQKIFSEYDACETLSSSSYLGYLDHNIRGREDTLLYHTLLPGPGRTPTQRAPSAMRIKESGNQDVHLGPITKRAWSRLNPAGPMSSSSIWVQGTGTSNPPSGKAHLLSEPGRQIPDRHGDGGRKTKVVTL